MAKKLLTNTSYNFDDFRDHLLKTCKKQKYEVIDVTGLYAKIIDWQPIFGNIFFHPKDIVMFNKNHAGMFESNDSFLSMSGYLIDENSMSKSICENKNFLLSYLKWSTVPVGSLCVGKVPLTNYALEYQYSSLPKIIQTKGTNPFSSDKFISWESDTFTGWLIYYYFGEAVCISTIQYKNRDEILAIPLYPEDEPMKLTSTSNFYRHDWKKAKVSRKEIVDLTKFGSPKGELVQSLSYIMDLLSLASGELLVTMLPTGKIQIVDVYSTHEPLSIDIIGEEAFLNLMEQSFINLMENEDDKERQS